MKKLLYLFVLLIPFSLAAQEDGQDITVSTELSVLYTFGIPDAMVALPKMVIRGKRTEVGLGLAFPKKFFANEETVSLTEGSSFLSGVYGFYSYRINKSEENALSLQYSLLFQQAAKFQLNEVNYRETVRIISTLDQSIGYTFRKQILPKFYLRQSAGVGVITYLTGKDENQSAIQFGGSKFGLSGMIDLGLGYTIR